MPDVGRVNAKQLQQQVAAIEAGADEDGVLPDARDGATVREAFGAWLVQQENGGRWFAPVAKAARLDPRFPKRGDPDAVRRHLSAAGADPETFEMLDDAELDWSAL